MKKDKQMNVMDIKIDFTKIGPGYVYCFNAECKQAETCVHYLAGSQVPADKEMGLAVFPGAFRKRSCRFYHEAKEVTFAYGFEHIYDQVRRNDYTAMRKELTLYLGNVGQYYRYKHGEKGLSPAQQKHIVEVFRRYGYTEDIVFDRYEQQLEY